MSTTEVKTVAAEARVFNYDDYVKRTRGPYCDHVYTIMALAGEAGEIANEMKKAMRVDAQPDRETFAYELGDVLWYVTCEAHNLGYTLQDIAEMNIAKLDKRRAKGLASANG